MKKKNLIVFDIDDTLTSSEKKHTDSLLFAMDNMGIKNVDTDWRNYANATDSYIVKTNFERVFQKDFSLELLKDFEKVMTDHFVTYPDSKEVLGAKKIVDFFEKETNYGVCFATGSLFQPALLKLEQAGIIFSEEVLETSNQIYTREGIVSSAIDKAKKYYNVTDFDHIISFGDGLWDVTTAENLGLHFVGVNKRNVEDFKKQKVLYHIEDWTSFDLNKAEEIFKIN
ncbi:HAD family hydrolase [Tenacibaculum jejuense]|uniref:Haloacid dehalogenase-like hydrolase n=1 Tax=Tenacibaculum jejuense TaxID=584609 RepID=A0A238UDM4_9FLAO|nr:HAD family hydrolase [Tenacibaculum jejuense]SNR17303.1 Haloacid dehalogenase-like hydrolase [Tenacibaculum jejuense]